MPNYIELKNNDKALTLSDYNALPVNAKNVKVAKDMPNGTYLEVFDENSGKIVIYAEAIKELWYER